MLATVLGAFFFKLVQVLGGGQQAGNIQRGTANEGLVITQLRGQQPQFLQLGVDRLVDVIVGGDIGPVVGQAFRNDDDLGADVELGKARLDKGLASLAGGKRAIVADSSDRVVVADINGEGGDIPHRAVGILRL